MKRAHLFPALASMLLGTIASLEAGAQPAPKPAAPPAPPVPAVGKKIEVKAEANPSAKAAAVPIVSPEEATLQAAHLAAREDVLLDFFRQRCRADVEPMQVASFVRRLGDPSKETQDAAFGGLVRLGPVAVNAVRQTANNLDDAATAKRARQCLEYLQGAGSANVARAAAKLLGQKHPTGAVEALLAYVPVAEDRGVVDEISTVLVSLALKDGKPVAPLRQALSDALPIRRAVAAEALCRAGGTAVHDLVRPLLKDAKPTVRLRAALSLARNHDADAVPVLIDLLAELPPTERKMAEDYLTELAGEWAIKIPAGNEAVMRHVRRDVWAAWWKSTTGANLLEEFRKRTLPEKEHQQVVARIKDLGSNDLEVRERASAILLHMGASAAPLLHQAVQSGDPQARVYAQKCLELIEKDGSTILPAAAVRLLALRKPQGAAASLLGYLPFAESEMLAAEIKTALEAVAVVNGKPDPVLMQALRDPIGVRRAVAAEILCQSGGASNLVAVRPLLTDADLPVRMRVGLALASARDKAAIPVLIGLVGELPAEQAWRAEEYLYSLAGDQAPPYPPAHDAAARRKWRDDWTVWWQKHGSSVDLVRFEESQRSLGLTLVVEQYNRSVGAGRVFEMDSGGKIIWQIGALQHPLDAQCLPGDRVLIVEQSANRVSERDRKGTIIWQKSIPNPFRCIRLADGHTFVACRHQIVDLDRDGKETVLYRAAAGNIAAATRLRDGQIALVTYNNQYFRLDAKGKEVRNANVPFVANNIAQFVDFLSHDHLLVAQYNGNKVAEYDLEGKIVWEAKIDLPGNPTRLPNGNVLVVSRNNRVVELSRSGQTVREWNDNMTPWRASRR